MMKEYEVISVKQPKLENKLNETAKEVREVVSVCPNLERLSFRTQVLVTLRRDKK